MDAFLLLISAALFGLFAMRSYQLEERSGIQNFIATLVSGDAERKLAHTHSFNTVKVGDPLYNLDAIWVGKNKKATVRIETGQVLELSEMTLLLLKRPFKTMKQDLGVKSQEFKLLKGHMVLNGKITLSPEDGTAAEIELPKIGIPENTDPTGFKIPEEVYPKQNSEIYIRESLDREFVFKWSKPVEGMLSVQIQDEGGSVRFVELHNQRTAPVVLAPNHTYLWKILNSQNKIQFGPYRFNLKVIDDDEKVKSLLNKKGDNPVEVYW